MQQFHRAAHGMRRSKERTSHHQHQISASRQQGRIIPLNHRRRINNHKVVRYAQLMHQSLNARLKKDAIRGRLGNAPREQLHAILRQGLEHFRQRRPLVQILPQPRPVFGAEELMGTPAASISIHERHAKIAARENDREISRHGGLALTLTHAGDDDRAGVIRAAPAQQQRRTQMPE